MSGTLFFLDIFKDYSSDELSSIFVMQGFSGISLFSVFLLMALGLAIIFGQMKVINMAHGEFLTAGAYTTVLLSDLVTKYIPAALPYYFFIAIMMAFFVAFILGYIVEKLIVSYLYERPLDTLLATWGVSMVMQQSFRLIFGAREDSATMPEWLMGSWSPTESISIPINGLFLLLMSILMTTIVLLLMYRSRWGLRVRATVQNREMSTAVGINSKKVDRWTFALGCGLAGIAGAAFTTIGSVSPSAGSLYIVDTFIVVVFGGAGSIIGTILSAFGIAQAQSILEFFLTGVLAKVFVLLAIVGILMIRPQGIVANKVRQ
ncbi:urea ABC transporter permease subunit UrtB [Desulfobacula sp.]|uniref:urea ABC transporter permease subunit UrtB n=1 Tax=Desulfobacula sp. TaxID=2593537 RepID=UPI0026073631|nr:urea ABC transporter permease subunit UrtB [Desulfobacula sp.]